MTDQITSSIRTVAALLAGVLVTKAAKLGIDVDQEWATGALIVLTGTAWHAAASKLQRRYPTCALFRFLLIAGKPPTYAPTASPTPSSPFDQPAVDPFNRPAG